MQSDSVKEITPRTLADLLPRASATGGEALGPRAACPHQPWAVGGVAQPPVRPSGMVSSTPRLQFTETLSSL